MAGIMLKANERVAFFGDSITEADPGYVSFIAEMLNSLYPELGIEVLNRGVGGNRVRDLLARVDEDIIDASPDWVSVAIGINDVWHGPDGTALGPFTEQYDELIRRLKAGTQAKVVLCTPSIIGEDPDTPENAALEGYARAVEDLGRRYDLTVVPIRDVFMNALRRARVTTDKPLFTTDGVHLNQAGNTLYGTTWLKTMGAFEDLLSPGS